MRVIAPFGSELQDIANFGCHRIASLVADGLFSAKIAKAVERVTAAKSRLSKLETELKLQELPRRGFSWEFSDRELDELKRSIEFAEYDLNEALEQHNAVLEAKSDCYWYIYVGDGPYRQ